MCRPRSPWSAQGIPSHCNGYCRTACWRSAGGSALQLDSTTEAHHHTIRRTSAALQALVGSPSGFPGALPWGPVCLPYLQAGQECWATHVPLRNHKTQQHIWNARNIVTIRNKHLLDHGTAQSHNICVHIGPYVLLNTKWNLTYSSHGHQILVFNWVASKQIPISHNTPPFCRFLTIRIDRADNHYNRSKLHNIIILSRNPATTAKHITIHSNIAKTIRHHETQHKSLKYVKNRMGSLKSYFFRMNIAVSLPMFQTPLSGTVRYRCATPTWQAAGQCGTRARLLRDSNCLIVISFVGNVCKSMFCGVSFRFYINQRFPSDLVCFS